MQKISFLNLPASLCFMACPFLLKSQVPGKGLLFDGDDDYVNVITTSSDELNPVETLTLECWVYLHEAPSSSHNPHLISRFNCYSLTIETNGRPRAYMQNDEGDWFLQSGTTMIATHQWYHLAATYDGSHMRVFVNGRLEGATAVHDTMARTTANFRIGSRNAYVTTTNTNGIIDEARVWDIARTQEEIRAAMNRTIPGDTPGLVGYWRFDEGSGTSANCETGYDNDGTLTNMSLPSAWIISAAPLGEASVYAESSTISETGDCAVDVIFRTGEGPGAGHSMSAMQVNQIPNSSTGLHPDRANLYWEIWSEDPDFDGDFTADVQFHYDDIGGLPAESSLELYRRDNAAGTWSAVSGYTLVTDDGGSSTDRDGIGYVELTITESTPGNFSGQYILTWSDAPPVVSDIPDQTVAEGSLFATITLDNYVADPDNTDDQITWTATGEDDVTVVITDRVATITVSDPDWFGTDIITFTAEDPEGATDSDQVTFEVTPVNDPPVVSDIPGEEIAEGASFAAIGLDAYVSDVEDPVTAMTWTATGQTHVTVDITARVATITVIDTNWNGSDTIIFQAEDTEGGTDSDTAIFTVTPVNDPPIVSTIPNQIVAEDEAFATINLDDYVTDSDNTDAEITWTSYGENWVTVTITDRVATIVPDDPEWNGTDRVYFRATDPDGSEDQTGVNFTVTFINDLPVVSDIPDQTIAEGQGFSQINLDDFVEDVDDPDSLISWTVSSRTNLTVSILNRVATIAVNDPDWNGSDTLVFTATDASGVADSDTSVCNVTPVNDPPVVSAAIPDTSAEAGKAFIYVLGPNTFTDIDEGDRLLLTASMKKGGVTAAWISLDAMSGTFSGTPTEADTGTVEVMITAIDSSFATVTDTFSIRVVSHVGMVNPMEGLEINLYPNPNDGRFVIESDRFEFLDVVLEIFNQKGQLVWNRKIRYAGGMLHEPVDLDNAADGFYLLMVRNKSGMINKQFVISH